MSIEEAITRYFIKISEDGEVTKVDDPENGERLETMQKAVGGNIEVVGSTFGEAVKLVLNEDGKNTGFGKNRLATAIAVIRSYDYIAGDALVVCQSGEELAGFKAAEADFICGVINVQKLVMKAE